LKPLLKLTSKREKLFLLFILIYSFIPTFGGLFRLVLLSGVDFGIDAENPRALAEPVPFAVHVLASFVFCIAGAVQFTPSIRRLRPELHRTNGHVVAIAGLIVGLTGLWMTISYSFPPELQGSLLYWFRVVISISMMALIIRAVIAIRSKDILQHSAAMTRAYAIAQGASTQTFIGIAWIVATGHEPLGLVRDWLLVSGWILNFAVAEIINNKRRAPKMPVRRLPTEPKR